MFIGRLVKKFFLTICCLSLLATEAEAQFFNLSGFGLAESVSNNGRATGSFGNPDGEYFLWEIGVDANNIGGVASGGGVGGSPSISDDGLFIGGTNFNASSGFHEMSRYDVAAGTWTALGGLGSSSGSEISSGWGISGNGQSLVGLAWVNPGQTHAVQWLNGTGIIDIGSTAGGQSARANAANIDGSVLAGWQDGAGRQGAVWVNGVQELIFDSNGQPAEEASDVSNDGRFAFGLGIAPNFNGVGNAYRYDIENDTFQALPNLTVGAERTMAAASATSDGKIAVGGTWGFGVPASFGNGLIWEEELGTMTPREYFESKGVKGIPANYNFNFVAAVSANGKWFAGWGGTGAIANQSWAVCIGGDILLGDVNLDGVINLLDVAPFVEQVASQEFLAEADTNQDGLVNLLDVAPFVEILGGS